MQNKEPMFFSAIIVLGVMDWLTTTTGVLFFGATEVNPVLSGLTKSSMLIFSAVKLIAVGVIGLVFYEASTISKPKLDGWHFPKKFLYGGYLLTVLALSVVVTNNMLSLMRA